MKLPTPSQCLGYFKEYKVPQNIQTHCAAVRRTAVFLAKALRDAGVPIDVETVDRLSFLHDLFKVVAIDIAHPSKFHSYVASEEEIAMANQLKQKYAGMYEGQVAYEVFKNEFPKFALALRNVSDPHVANKTWEEMLVHYADWRTFRNKVVSLQERLDYLQQAYPKGEHIWGIDKPKVIEFEQKLKSLLLFNPDQLNVELGKFVM